MKSKLFLKLYLRVSLIILITFTVLGATLFLLIYNYTVNLKQKQLMESASKISSFAYLITENSPIPILKSFRSSVEFYANSVDADIYIFSTNGEIIFSKTGITKANRLLDNLPDKIIGETTSSRAYTQTGNLEGFYDENLTSVCVSFNNSQMQTAGVVVLSSSLNPFSGLLMDMMGMFLIALLFSLIVAYIVLYFVVLKFLKPLREINDTVKLFAKGDFSARLTVTDNDEISELSTSINHLSSSLQNIEKMRSDFISDISHELKTPMTSILGFVGGILDGVIEENERDKYLKIVEDEIKRLSRLVNSLLDVSKFVDNSQSFSFTNFSIKSVAESVISNLQIRADEKSILINFMCKEDVIVYGEQDSIYRVIYNLLDNAIKFSFVNETIDIVIVKKDDKTYFGIKNKGEGISSNDIPFVFDRLYKCDKSRTLGSGYGLGLFITKEIIKAHRGDIWVKSTPQDVTEFVFYI